MEALKGVKLPVGYVSEEGRGRLVNLKPLSGRALLEARGKLGDPPDPTFILDILRDAVVGFEDYKGPIDHERFFWVDADYIFRELALFEAKALNRPLTVIRICPHCGNRTESEVRWQEQTVRYVEETAFQPPHFTIDLELSVPITGLDPDNNEYTNVTIGLLTVEDEIERWRKYAKQPTKMWQEGIRAMIQRLGPKSKEAIFPADVERLSALDIKRIEAVYNANEPGLGPLPPLVCKFCRREFNPDPFVTWLLDFILVPAPLA